MVEIFHKKKTFPLNGIRFLVAYYCIVKKKYKYLNIYIHTALCLYEVFNFQKYIPLFSVFKLDFSVVNLTFIIYFLKINSKIYVLRTHFEFADITTIFLFDESRGKNVILKYHKEENVCKMFVIVFSYRGYGPSSISL